MIFKTFLLTAITLGLFTASPLATALPANKDNAANAPVILNYRTANIDGVEVFYREAGPKRRPYCCCYTVSRPRRICFVILSLNWRTEISCDRPRLPWFWPKRYA